jgi:hypothetical protein
MAASQPVQSTPSRGGSVGVRISSLSLSLLISSRRTLTRARGPNAGERASEASTTFAHMSAVMAAFAAAGCEWEQLLEEPSDEPGKPTKVFRIKPREGGDSKLDRA